MTEDGRRVYTVSELTAEIQNLLEGRFQFVWVEAEISNFSAPLSGHYYLTLKDEKAQMRAVMFRLQARQLKFRPEDGMRVIAQGRLGVYAPRGEYQLILDYLEPLGVGALALAFEQLKQRLAAEGLFDAAIKKPLPFLPRRVAVITSPTGAAVRDFLKIIRRRFANIEVDVVPVRVQGEGAAEELAGALDWVNRLGEADVIVLTRGGGSLEDLWAFNQESVARAIRRSGMPVVSAVGHEIDLTISDLAADFRAPTPSAAAEMLVMEKEALIRRLEELAGRTIAAVSLTISRSRKEFGHLSRRVRDPRRRLAEAWLRLDELLGRLPRLFGRVLENARARLTREGRALTAGSPLTLAAAGRQGLGLHREALQRGMSQRLEDESRRLRFLQQAVKVLSPQAVLERGYSITFRLPERRVVRRAGEMTAGEQVEVRLAAGGLFCEVQEVSARDGRDGI